MFGSDRPMLPITREDQIPNTRIESPTLDFKAAVGEYRQSGGWDEVEMAKDLAAMANTHGGTILIGIGEDGSRRGIAASEVNDLVTAFEENVAKNRCRPSVLVSCASISVANGRVVVAVNIWPAPMAPVGIRVVGNGESAAWRFPIRVASRTNFLLPDQFGTLENVSARRTAAQLAAIPESERENVRFQFVVGRSSDLPIIRGSIRGVDTVLNRLELLVPRDQAPFRTVQPGRLHLCLDWIGSVWRGDTGWEVVVNEVILRQQKDSKEFFVVVASNG